MHIRRSKTMEWLARYDTTSFDSHPFTIVSADLRFRQSAFFDKTVYQHAPPVVKANTFVPSTSQGTFSDLRTDTQLYLPRYHFNFGSINEFGTCGSQSDRLFLCMINAPSPCLHRYSQ